MAGDIEDEFADALTAAVVKATRMPAGLAKSDAAALRKATWRAVWPVARAAATETVSPLMAKLANLTERAEFLEEQQRQRAAGNGGWRG